MQGGEEIHKVIYASTKLYSFGVSKLPHLRTFLPECDRFVGPFSPGKFDSVAGWGYKDSAAKARAVALKEGVPYLALEDGFLRSIGLGRDGDPPMSLIVDPVGIYYDGSAPSLLEQYLEKRGWETDELISRARKDREWLIAERLSKYNRASEPFDDRGLGDKRVLVIDQTYDDASVRGALADDETFSRMLATAIDENPDAEILVKTHPDVLAGYRRGYLPVTSAQGQVRYVTTMCNPWDLIDGVQRVYTVSSQLGAEALLAGKEVHCFGLSFYAGWGLTVDHVPCERRTTKRTIDELFAAAWMLYPRYVDPVTGQHCEIEQVISLLSDRKRHLERVAVPYSASDFSHWKRAFLSDFFPEKSKDCHFVSSQQEAMAQAKKNCGGVLVWASKLNRELRDKMEKLSLPLLAVEDAFIRSSGLGVDLSRPWSLVFDDLGIYFDPRNRSRLEQILLTTTFPSALLERAERLRLEIVHRALSKYNLKSNPVQPINTDQRVILVPGQVEDDQSVLCGSPEITSNEELLKRVKEENRDAFVIYKPHPDVVSGLRKGGEVDNAFSEYCDLMVTDVSITDLYDLVDEVHTMTSLSGFEALLRGKQVVTYGAPFYAGWGLTTDKMKMDRRDRTLSLIELVAGSLILYPVYIDPVSREVCTPEHLLRALADDGTRRGDSSTRLIRAARRFWLKLTDLIGK